MSTKSSSALLTFVLLSPGDLPLYLGDFFQNTHGEGPDEACLLRGRLVRWSSPTVGLAVHVDIFT